MRVRSNSDSLRVFLYVCFHFLLINSMSYAGSFDNKPAGGTISTSDPTEICITDNVLDVINIDLVDNVGDSSIFVLTSDAGVIRQLSTIPSFNLTGLDKNAYRILHIGYDEFTIGPRVGLNIKKLKGWFGLSNEIVINLFSPFSGFVRSVVEIEQTICVSDGVPDNITLEVTSVRGDTQGWLVTDSKGIITQLVSTPQFNFEGTGAGIVNIHHYSSFGDVQVRIGQNVNKISGCIDFSRPFIIEKIVDCNVLCDIPTPVIVFGEPTLSLLNNDQDSIFICFDDDIADVLTVVLDTASLSRFVLLDSDKNVIEVFSNRSELPLIHSTDGDCQLILFNFLDDVPTIQIGSPLLDFDGCFTSSEPVTIVKETDCAIVVCDVDAGVIELANGASPTVCADDGIDDQLEFIVTGNVGASTWIVTDENGVILRNQNSPIFNFEGIALQTCIIRHMSLQDPISNFGIGENISDIMGCFEFSNAISITKEINCGIPVCNVIGGIISANGQTELTICVDDGEPDLITPVVSNNIGDTFWLLTDTLGNIMLINRSNMFNLEGAGEGVCQLWHLSAGDIEAGFSAGRNVSDIIGCFDLSNPITITREINCGFVCDIDAGNIALQDGSTDVSICVEDPSQNTVTVVLSGNSGSSTWLVTDLNGNIITIQNSPVFVFDNADISSCQIWHMSLLDPITGFVLGNSVSDIEGCFDISNPINITKETDCFQTCTVQGGSISFGGFTQFNFCADDGLPDSITPMLSDNSGSSAWLLVDDQGVIISIQQNADFQFEGSPAGSFSIVHISSDDTVGGLNPGGNIANLTGCFDLSNQIIVILETGCGVLVCDVQAGMIDIGGAVAVDLCVVDSQQDIVDVNLSGNSGSSIWLVTDESGNILAIQNDSNFDFTNAEVGVCFIWHMSLQDPLTGFAIGANVSGIDGCFELSNSIQVNKLDNCGMPVCDVLGGTISVEGETSLSVCVVDDEADIIPVTLTGNQGSSTWLVTDAQGNILAIQNDSSFDFTNSPIGTCTIWHLSLTGTLGGFSVGSNVNQLAGCFSLSNPVTVTKLDNCGAPVCDVLGGTISIEGESTVNVCVVDMEADVVTVTLSENRGSSIWLVTDNQGNILEIQNDSSFDFTNSPFGTCTIWHLSLTGTLDGFSVGSNVNQLAGCFALSNPVTVNKIDNCGAPTCNVSSGTIAGPGGVSSLTVCADDGMVEGLEISLTGNVGPSTWVITDASGQILRTQNTNIFTFEGGGEGVCLIYHLSLENTITGFTAGELISNLGGCFSLSTPIRVTKEINCGPDPCIVEGGSLTFSNGTTTSTICVDDGQNDVLDVSLTGNVGATAWILTDEQGIISDIRGTLDFNFEGFEAGTCFLYHISLLDPVTGFAAGVNINGLGGCFDLSNPISIIKVRECGPNTCSVDGGVVMSSDSLTVLDVCVTDGENDNIQLVLQGGDGARLWAVTDARGEILVIQVESVFNFEGTGGGTNFIYNVALRDPITGFDVGNNLTDIQGCFDLSNPLTVNKLEDCNPAPVPVGGSITSDVGGGAGDITVCADDGESDRISLTLNGSMGESTWIVTDTTGQILIVQAVATFEFEGSGAGIAQIWHVASFGDVFGLQAGQNIADVTGNFALSNQINVIREVGCGPPDCAVNGGNIETTNNETFLILCVTDDEPDVVNISLDGNSGTSNYIVTDPQGNIITIQNEPSFDFTNNTPGRCFIWHVSSDGDLENFEVGQAITSVNGCFVLSNSVEISKIDGCAPLVCDDIMSGSISTMNGQTAVTICVDDNMDENIVVDVVDNIGGSIWVTTDANDIILTTQNDNIFNFEGEPSGQCFIRHIAALDEITGLIPGNSISELGGCFQISEGLAITRELCSNVECTVSGGAISIMDLGTDIEICVTDNMSDQFTVDLNSNTGISQWIIVDSVGTIIGIQEGSDNTFDFESSAIGMCQIWHISTRDSTFNLMLGMDIATLEGCHSLSNAITVVRLSGACANPECAEILPGSIALLDGEIETTLCVDDGMNENLEVMLTGNTGAGFFVITDADGIILDLENEPLFNFEGSDTGVCLIYYASVLEPFGGLRPGVNITDVTGCVNLSNIITVEKESCVAPPPCVVSGGAISTSNGETEITICADDEIADPIDFTLTGASGISMWLLTDSAGNVTQTFDGSTIDFEGSDEGRCLVVHATVRDSSFIIRDGDNTNDLMGCFELSNAIIINKEIGCATDTCVVDGGAIALADGSTEITICALDGISDEFEVIVTDNVGANSVFVAADTTGQIIALQLTPFIDLEGIGAGVTLIYHVSLRDTLSGGELGQNINELNGCLDISNAITVIQDAGTFNGGTIDDGNGNAEITICDDDGVDAEVNLVLTGEEGELSIWLLTDDDGNIIQLFNSGPPFMIPDGSAGTQIWHMSYSSNLIGLNQGMNVMDLQGCFDLSNSVTLIKETNCATALCEIAPSIISFDGGGDSITVCTDDGMDDSINVNLTSIGNDSMQWLVTDNTGVILFLSDGPPFNFEGQDAGVCQIWHLIFMDSISGLTVGANASMLSGCFELSNPLTVTKENDCGQQSCGVIAAVISFDGGLDMTTVCVDDNMDEALMVNVTPGIGDTSVWVITDTLGVILSFPEGPMFNFEGSGEGVCLLWNLTIEDSVTGLLIDSNANDLEGCFALSNPLRIEKEIDCADMNMCLADGGNLTANGGQTSITVCSGDGFIDLITFEVDAAAGNGEVFLVTDTAGIIARIEGEVNIDFEGEDAGTSLVYHVGFIGMFDNVIIGGNIDNIGGCFDLSNPVEVIVETDCLDCPAVGGSIELDDGTVETVVCAGDGEDNFLGINLTVPAGQESVWVVTDTLGVILAAELNSNFNFDDFGEEIVQVWHLGSFGTVLGIVLGENVSDLDGCFEFSNPITVRTDIVDGGSVNADDMATELTICVQDSIRDVINLFNDSESNLSYTYLITDINNRFLAVNTSGSVDLESLSVGNCRIYGVSHTGTTAQFTIGSQEDVTQVPIASCFELSSNFIQLSRVSGDQCPDSGLTEPTVSLVALGNPANDELVLRINSSNIEGPITIELNDANGRLMMKESMNLEIGETTKSIDVSSLQSGIYYASIRHPWIVLNERIVVQH